MFFFKNCPVVQVLLLCKYARKEKKEFFYSAVALNSFRPEPSNRRDLLRLECALSSFKGEIPHIACKMPSALARADHWGALEDL
jgi:hypothetical protein